MCDKTATTKNQSTYQRQHISIEDVVKGDTEDNNKDYYDYTQEETLLVATQHAIFKRNHRRKLVFITVFVLFVLMFVLVSMTSTNQKQQQQSKHQAYNNDDDNYLDDDNTSYKVVSNNNDDDSVSIHDEPILIDETTHQLIKIGQRNIKKLSLLTHQTNNITAGCETTILLMRHCEKLGDDTTDNNGNEHCDYIGHQRSYWLPSLFGDKSTSTLDDNNSTTTTTSTNSHARWPIPSYLYALSPVRENRMTYRQVETLLPLANKFGLYINADYPTNNELVDDVFHLIGTGQTCGKLIVINWRHHMIPNLAKKLGCINCPIEYPQDSFDQVWEMKYVWDVHKTNVYRKSNGDITVPSSASTSTSTNNNSNNLRRQLKKKNKKTTKGRSNNNLKNKVRRSTVVGVLDHYVPIF